MATPQELEIDVMIRSHFAKMEVISQRPYSQWKEGFIRRWGLVPTAGKGYEEVYMAQRKLDPRRMTIIEAAQTFHVNEFRFEQDDQVRMQLLFRMEADYDSVPPEIYEGDVEHDHGNELDRYLDKMDNHRPDVGRKIFLP